MKQQIENLKQKERFQYFKPITQKPIDFEPYISKACSEGKLSSVQWLIEKENVNKNQAYIFKGTVDQIYAPIHFAVSYGHYSIVKYLIEQQNVDIEIKASDGKTSLHFATKYGKNSVFEYLVYSGADINATDYYYYTPLHYAALNGNTDLVKKLISLGADKYARNISGQTPYNIANNDEMKPFLI